MSNCLQFHCKAIKHCVIVACLISTHSLISFPTQAAPTSPPNFVGTIGGQNYAEFFATDIAVTTTGDIYYTDAAQKAVLRYDQNGSLVKKISGFPAFVRGINVCPDGRIYVGANRGGDIFILDQNGDRVEAWRNIGTASGEGFCAKDGLLYQHDGNQVIALDRTGKVVRRLSGSGTGIGQHTSLGDIAVASNGDVWTLNLQPPRVQKFSSTGQVKLAFGSSGSNASQFKFPASIAIDSLDNIYISDRRNSRIQKFDSSGRFLKSWGSQGTGPGQFYESHGIFVDHNDTLWVAGFHSYSVQQFDTEGNLLKFLQRGLPSGGDFTTISGIAVADDVQYGNERFDSVIYVVDKYNNRIQALDPNTGNLLFRFGIRGQGPGSVFNFPRSIAIGPNKDLYISDDGHTRRISPDGTFKDIYSYRSQTGGGQIGASGIAVHSNGLLYQSNEGRSTMFTIDTNVPSGRLLSEWRGSASAPGRMVKIRSVALAGNELYVTDFGDGSVKIYDLNGTFRRVFANAIPGVAGITVDERQGIVYVGGSGRVRAFNLSGQALFSFGTPGTGPGQFGNRISGIAVASPGTVFVADTVNGRIHRYSYSR